MKKQDYKRIEKKSKSKIKTFIGAVIGLIIALLTLFTAFKSGECTIESKFCLEYINGTIDAGEETVESYQDL